MMSEVLLVNVVGTDRPGLTHALTRILAAHGVRVLDLGQAVIHDHLSLGMLIQVPDGANAFEPLKQMLFEAHELGLSIRFTPIEPEEYADWVAQQVQERTVITILGRTLAADVIAQLTGVLVQQGLNIEKISRLSRRIPLEGAVVNACLEFSVLGSPRDPDALRAELVALSQRTSVDFAIQADDMYRRNRRLIVFDMDSTLIQIEVIDELARRAGVYSRVAEITEKAMRGELDFKQSFTERLALLKGLPWSEVEALCDTLPLMEGAERLIGTLKKLGYTTAICSGGFLPFGHQLQRQLGIDYVFANELEAENGVLTGRVAGDIVDGAKKAEHLRALARDLGLSLRQAVAVGDGANDLPMIQAAGLGIAFRAKPLVRASADQSLNVLGLDGILYLLGVRDRDLMRGTERPESVESSHKQG